MSKLPGCGGDNLSDRMTSEQKCCPKCGAERTQEASSHIKNMMTIVNAEVYACKSHVHFIDGFRQSKSCRIAQVTAENSKLREQLEECERTKNARIEQLEDELQRLQRTAR